MPPDSAECPTDDIVFNFKRFRSNKGREIDFRAVRDGKLYLIQVAYSVAEEKVYDREFSAFAGIDNTVKKIIITNDEIDYSTSTVYHYKLRDFLLMDEL